MVNPPRTVSGPVIANTRTVPTQIPIQINQTGTSSTNNVIVLIKEKFPQQFPQKTQRAIPQPVPQRNFWPHKNLQLSIATEFVSGDGCNRTISTQTIGNQTIGNQTIANQRSSTIKINDHLAHTKNQLRIVQRTNEQLINENKKLNDHITFGIPLCTSGNENLDLVKNQLWIMQCKNEQLLNENNKLYAEKNKLQVHNEKEWITLWTSVRISGPSRSLIFSRSLK